MTKMNMGKQSGYCLHFTSIQIVFTRLSVSSNYTQSKWQLYGATVKRTPLHSKKEMSVLVKMT